MARELKQDPGDDSETGWPALPIQEAWGLRQGCPENLGEGPGEQGPRLLDLVEARPSDGLGSEYKRKQRSFWNVGFVGRDTWRKRQCQAPPCPRKRGDGPEESGPPAGTSGLRGGAGWGCRVPCGGLRSGGPRGPRGPEPRRQGQLPFPRALPGLGRPTMRQAAGSMARGAVLGGWQVIP